MKLKKFLSVFLAVCMILTSSVQTFAEVLESDQNLEILLEQMLAGDEADQYPNGKIEFLATRMNASKSLKSVDITVLRKGGTEGSASVEFKAIDVTSKYGEDYVIKVKSFPFTDVLPKNENAKPLVESYSEVDDFETIDMNEHTDDFNSLFSYEEKDDINEESNLDEEYLEENDLDAANEEDVSLDGDDASIEDEGIAEEIVEEAFNVSDIEEEEVTLHKKNSGLRGSKEIFTGVKDIVPNWREAQGVEKEAITDAYDQFYNELEGVSTRIEFADGEYRKDITFEIIDNNISKGDVQILLVLTNVEGAVLGEKSNGFLNIADDGPADVPLYQMKDSGVFVNNNQESIDLTIERTQGIYKFSSVLVRTTAISAVPNVNYTPFSTEVVFPQGIKEQTIKVPLKGNTSKASLEFAVVLDDESAEVVSERAATIITISGNDEGNEEIQLNNSMVDITPFATQPAAKQLNNSTIDLSISTVTQRSTDLNIDLLMVQDIQIEWENQTPGTNWVETVNCKDYVRTAYDGYVSVNIGNRELARIEGRQSRQTTPYISITDSDREKTKITIKSGVSGKNKLGSAKVFAIRYRYRPYYFNINNTPINGGNRLVPKKWNINGNLKDPTTNKRYTNETPITVGGMTFFGESKTTNSAPFYAGQSITFTPYFENGIDSNAFYLAGFNIRNGSIVKFYEQNTVIMSSEIPNFIKANLVQNNGSNKQINIEPVFKPRTAFVKFLNNNAEKGYIQGFESYEIFKTNMMDTIEVSGIANTGSMISKYSVTGYSPTSASVVTTNAENAFSKKNINDVDVVSKFTDSAAFTGVPITENAAIPNIISFKPSKQFTMVEPFYSEPFITAKVNPRINENDKKEGAVYYVDEKIDVEGGFNSATGKFQDMVISPFEPGKVYSLKSINSPGYRTVWQDFTGDVKEPFGILDTSEAAAVSGYNIIRDSVVGSTFNFLPLMSSPLIYFSFEPVSAASKENKIEGRVYLEKRAIFDTGRSTLVPLHLAEVMVDNRNMRTESDGYFCFEGKEFYPNEKRVVTILHDSITYSTTANVNISQNYNINEYTVFNVINPYIKKDSNAVSIKEISNSDNVYTIGFDATSDSPLLAPRKAEFKFYSKEGIQRLKHDSESFTNTFTYSFNPASLGVAPGDYMTVKLYDQNGKGYVEHELGFTFNRDITTFNLIKSFDVPFKGAVDILGKIDTTINLGISGKINDYFKTDKDTGVKTLFFGFEKNFEKTFESKKEEVEEATQDGQTDKVNSLAKSSVNTSGDSLDANGDEKSNEFPASLTAHMDIKLKIGISVTMYPSEEQKGEYYFKEMLLMATAGSGLEVEVEIALVGINVIVLFKASGDLGGLFSISQYNDKEFYFDESGSIDFTNIGNYDANRDFTAYGSLNLKPKVSLGLGTGLFVAKIVLSGVATFDLNFDTYGNDNGKLSLGAEILVKVLFFETDFYINIKDMDLFNTPRNMLFNENNLLFESASKFRPNSRQYLHNTGSWNNSPQFSAYAVSDLTETVIQEGIFPYPDTQLAELNDGRKLLLFIADDGSRPVENSMTLKYSIFNGVSWSNPISLDNTQTLNDSPRLLDLGDKIIVAWSSAARQLTGEDSAIDALNSRDIKTAFFDKATNTFGSISNLTYITDEDIAGDFDPHFAYDDQSNQLVVFYTKSEYGFSDNPTEDLVGDVLNPSYSVIAYRFYDFENDKWRDTYTDEEKDRILESIDEEKFDEYEQNWYGQGILDLAPKVIITQPLDESAYQREEPTFTKFNDITPAVVESNVITYNGLSLFTYILDYDNNSSTTYDREIFLQIYDFDEKTFTHPIQITNDDVSDSNIRFIRADGETILAWISDGSIKYMNLSYIVRNDNVLKLTTIDDNDIYYIDKTPPENGGEYVPPTIVVDPGENKLIGSFDISSDNKNHIFLAWTKDGLSYKDGILQTSEEAALVENQFSERQLYVQRFTKTGDTFSDGEWSAPVQITTEKGANYDQIDFIVSETGEFEAILTKGMSTIVELENGETTVNEDYNNRSLVELKFNIIENIEIDEAKITKLIPGGLGSVETSIKNDGLDTRTNISVVLYNDDVEIQRENIEVLKSGETHRSYFEFDVAEDAVDYNATVKVIDSFDTVLATYDLEKELMSFVTLSEISVEHISRGVIEVNLTAMNEGDVPTLDTETITVRDDISNDVIGTYNLGTIEPYSKKRISFAFDVADKYYIAQENDSIDDKSVTELLSLSIAADGLPSKASIKRTANNDQMNSMNQISNLRIDLKEELEKDDSYLLNVLVSPVDVENLRVIWSHSNPEVAELYENGLITGLKEGTTTITALVMPKNTEIVLTNERSWEVDNYISLPASAIKEVKATLTVIPEDEKPEPEPEPDSNAYKSSGRGVAFALDTVEIQDKADEVVEDKNSISITEGDTTVTIPGSFAQEGMEIGVTRENNIINVNITKDGEPIDVLFNVQTKYESEENNFDTLVVIDKNGNPIVNSYREGNLVKFEGSSNGIYTIFDNKKIFNDVLDNSWFNKPVNYLAARNVIMGVGNDLFAPNREITRADFITMLMRMLQLKSINDMSPEEFNDVSNDMYYYEPVRLAQIMGIAAGYSDGSFRPNAPISRQDMFVFTARAIASSNTTATGVTFADSNEIAPYAVEAISKLSALGIITGYQNKINPKNNITRAETAQVLYSVIENVIKK